MFVCCALFTNASFAQVINGDLNHNQGLDVEDVTLLIDGYLTGETEQIQTDSNPFMADNSLIVGTWYNKNFGSITFREDGTSDYMTGYTYKFKPYQGYILFYNSDGIPAYFLKVAEVTADYMAFLPEGGDRFLYIYKSTPPTTISLSETSLLLKPEESVQLTVMVEPAGTVAWSSSNEKVATVVNGLVSAVADGIAFITASAGDATATCTVTVDSRTYNNGHEYVDLGLSVKWAAMNVGANTYEGYGDYFAWGETSVKSTYGWDTYKWCNGTDDSLTKYNTKSSYGTVDNKTVLEPEDDAAYVNWGNTWRMPTHEEWTELKEKCTWTWTAQNSVNGYLVTASNSNSIFLPAAGLRSDMFRFEDNGFYWANSLYPDYPRSARNLQFKLDEVKFNGRARFDGFSVRAVCP